MAASDMKSNPDQDESGSDTDPIEDQPKPKGKKRGKLLDETDSKKLCDAVKEIRERGKRPRSKRTATWKRTSLWRKGHRHVKLDRSEDKWEAVVPLGMANAPPLPNKCDRILRRMTNVLLSDEPVPECEPASDSPEDRDAAEQSTRMLKIEGGESGFDMVDVTHQASDMASTYGSSFAFWYLDPTGGGREPKQVNAHPKAVAFDPANPDAVTLDPETGAGAAKEDYVERFITPDLTLSENELDADYTWLPAISPELMTGNAVTFIPEKVKGINDSKGVHLVRPTTLGALKSSYPEAFAKLSDEDLKKIVDWRPEGHKECLPEFMTLQPLLGENGKPSEDNVCFVYCVYMVASGEYPEGAVVCTAADEFVLDQSEWAFDFELPDGSTKRELMLLPISQCRQLNDPEGDPYGIGVGERIGPMDEVRAQVYLYAIEHLHRFANPHTFLPDGSIVQPKQLRRRNQEPIYFNPNGKPEVEKTPEFPNVGDLLRAEMTNEENDESSLQQAAQGVEDPSVDSGIHARTIVEEAQKGLAQIRKNLGKFYIRSNQIALQYMRVFFTAERRAKYEAEDGSYKEEAWTGSDLRSTRDVRIARGSFTMLGASAKRQMALDEIQTGVITPQDYQQLMSSNLAPLLGLQDNPYLMKIRRELTAWRKGPSPEWLKQADKLAKFAEMQATAAQVAGSIGADPASAAMEPPAPLQSPFRTVPSDEEQTVALQRHYELARAMQSKKFENFPPAWQQALVQEYQRMRMFAGIATVPEQQQAAAAQAASEQAANGKPGKSERPAQSGAQSPTQPSSSPPESQAA